MSIAEKSASMFDNPMTLCPSRGGEHAPQRPAEKQPIEVTSAGTRPVLPCIVCVSTTRCRRHHGNVVGACMHSPCNLGLSRLLSYITKGWFGMRYVGRTYPCFCIAAGSPNVIWHLHLPVVIHQHEPNNASARGTATITSPTHGQAAENNGSSCSILAPVNHATTLPLPKGHGTRGAGERRLVLRSQSQCSDRR